MTNAKTLLALALCVVVGAEAQSSGCVVSSSTSTTTYPVATAVGGPYEAFSPPKYPSPQGRGSGEWADAYEKARKLVKQMTLLEKVNVTTGQSWQAARCVGNTGSAPRLGIASLCLQDSPLGVRFADYASVFPAGLTIASTFSRDLFYRRGRAMGMEHKLKGVDIQLGPVSGPIGRIPEGGRNWEGGGADPYLSGVGLAYATEGIQDSGVMACAKHYIGNEQEHFRQSGESKIFVNESISSNIDDRTMHEVYLWPFADAVRAGVASIMCSYNQVNNSYGCQNSHLLNGLLKDELDFQGFVMSDWAAQHAGVATSLAGLDMTMPGDAHFLSGNSYWGSNLTVSILNGSIPEWRLDDQVTRIFAGYYKVGLDQDYVPTNFDSWTTNALGFERFFANENYTTINSKVDVRGTHGKLIREIAAKGTVLLKNNGALPLKNVKQIGVFGSDAGDNPLGPNGCSDRGCSDGTIAIGWGSGTASFPYLVSPLNALQNQAIIDGSVIQWATDDYNIAVINQTATQATACLVFVKADAGEGYITIDDNQGDRKNLTLWANGETVIQSVAANCKNTIVVIHAPGPILVESWIDHPNVTAVVFAGLPGQESGNSIVDVLYGRVNPAGRLPFTIAKERKDYGIDLMYVPNDYWAPQQDLSTNGLLIDYRYFDAKKITPRFEFGFGLSYTSFKYSNLKIKTTKAGQYVPFTGETLAATETTPSENPADLLFPAGFHQTTKIIYPYLYALNQTGLDGKGSKGPKDAYLTAPQPMSPASGAPGGNPGLYDVLYQITFDVKNTGPIGGEEVVQLYVSTGDEGAPPKVLRGFERISIDAGKSTTVTLDLLRRDVSYWDTDAQNWAIGKNTKTVYVGSSSRKLPLSAELPYFVGLGGVRK